jgi:hypothetical protein
LLLRELTKRKGKRRRDKVLAKTEFLKARLQEIDAQMTLKEIVRRRRDMLTDGVMVRKDDTMAASKTSPKGNSGEEAPSLVIEEKESDEDDFTSTRDDELPSTTIQINFAAVDLRIDTEPRSWHRAFARAVPNHLPLVRTLPELRAHATLDVDLEVVPKQRVRLYLHSFEVAQRGPLSENGFAETAMFRFGGTPCVVANLSRSLGENGKRNGASSDIRLGWEGHVSTAPLKVFCYKPSVDRLRELIVLPKEEIKPPKLKRDRVRAFEKAVLGVPLSLRVQLASTAVEQLRPYSRGKFLCERFLAPRMELYILKDGREALEITEGAERHGNVERYTSELPCTNSSTNLDAGFEPLAHAETAPSPERGMCGPNLKWCSATVRETCSVPDGATAPIVPTSPGGEETTAIVPASKDIFFEHDEVINPIPFEAHVNGNGYEKFDDLSSSREVVQTPRKNAAAKDESSTGASSSPTGLPSGVPWNVSMSFWTPEDMVARMPLMVNTSFFERENSV